MDLTLMHFVQRVLQKLFTEQIRCNLLDTYLQPRHVCAGKAIGLNSLCVERLVLACNLASRLTAARTKELWRGNPVFAYNALSICEKMPVFYAKIVPF
jgi:hypothetical protein